MHKGINWIKRGDAKKKYLKHSFEKKNEKKQA